MVASTPGGPGANCAQTRTDHVGSTPRALRAFPAGTCHARGFMKLHFQHAHSLAPDALRRRVDERVAHYVARYPHLPIGGAFHWHDERTAVGGYRGGTGTVRLGDRDVRIELELPFFARPFRARIEAFVERELETALAAG
ncbi:MAG: polyhydroxyalkanoic acid system family protein [Deltaproteobacteria bacterium]